MGIIDFINALVTPKPRKINQSKHRHRYEFTYLTWNGLWWEVYFKCECGVEKVAWCDDEELWDAWNWKDKLPPKNDGYTKKKLEDGGYI